MKLGRRFGISSSILLFLIIVAVAWGYSRLNGTPWGKTQAQQKASAFLQQKYGWSAPIIDSPIVWNSKYDDYEIGVTFPGQDSSIYQIASSTRDKSLLYTSLPIMDLPLV